MGCQPGSIRADGTCRVVTNTSNADIFRAEDLEPIQTQNTTFGGTPGYLARPAGDGSYPAVVMIHERWGLNQNIRQMADILAGHGYVVFAVDLYDGEVAQKSTQAGQLTGSVRDNPEAATDKMSANRRWPSIDVLHDESGCEPWMVFRWWAESRLESERRFVERDGDVLSEWSRSSG